MVIPKTNEEYDQISKDQFNKLKKEEVNDIPHVYYKYREKDISAVTLRIKLRELGMTKKRFCDISEEFYKHITKKAMIDVRIIARIKFVNKQKKSNYVYINENMKLNRIPNKLELNVLIRYIYLFIRKVGPTSGYNIKSYEGGYLLLDSKKHNLLNMKLLAEHLQTRLLSKHGLKFDKERNEFYYHVKDKYGKKHKMKQRNGYCVIDYIYNELHGRPSFRNLTKKQIIDNFNKIGVSIERGVTVEEMIKMFRAFNYPISMYVMNMYRKVFHEYVSDVKAHDRYRLCFMVGNKHLYPVTNEKLKALIANKKSFSLQNVEKNINWDNPLIIDYNYDKTSYMRMIAGHHNINGDVILLKNRDLRDSMNDHIVKTRTKIDQFDIKSTGLVSGYIHPKTGQYVTSYDDYDIRKKICCQLFEKTIREEFIWKNQSYAKISKDIFKVFCGNIPKASYNNIMRDEFDQNYCRPLIQKITNKSDKKLAKMQESSLLYGFDVIKSYTAVLYDNKYNIPLPTIHDKEELYNGEDISCGFYKIKNIKIGKLVIPCAWYSYSLIVELLKTGFLKKKDIICQYLCNHSIKCDTFKKFIEICYEFGENNGKNLVNYFTGVLNTKYFKSQLACIVNDYETVISLFSQSEENKNDFQVHKVGELFLCKEIKKIRKISDTCNIYMHVISGGIWNLLNMIFSLVDKKTEMYGVKVDSVLLKNPRKDYEKFIVKSDISLKKVNDDDIKELDKFVENNKTDYNIYVQSKEKWKGLKYLRNNVGKYRIEENIKLPEKYTEREEDISFMNSSNKDNKNQILDGPGGSGKSYSLTKNFAETWNSDKKNTFLLTFQNQNIVQLKNKMKKFVNDKQISEICKNIMTLHSFINVEEKPLLQLVDKISNAKNLFIDEYTNPPKIIYDVIYWGWVNSNKKLNIFMAGDQHQEQSIDTKFSINFFESSAIREMCPNLINVKFNADYGRCTQNLYNIVHKFLVDGTTSHFKFKKIDKTLKKWLCYTNKRRIKINKKISDQESLRKENKLITFVYQGKKETYKVFEGAPIVCTYNDKRTFFNGELWEVLELNDTYVTIRCITTKDRDIQKIEINKFRNMFTLSYAMTISKFQGSEIDEPYNIVECEQLTKNRFNVALSRSTHEDYIHTDKYLEKYESCKVSHKVLSISKETKKEEINIYQIMVNNKYSYVGQTEKQINERLKEHKNDPKSPIYKYRNKKLKISLICKASKKAATAVETLFIDKCKKLYGKKCLNIKQTKNTEESDYKVKKNLLVIKKYNIRQELNNGKPSLICRIQINGKRKTIRRAYNNNNKKEKMDDIKKEVNKLTGSKFNLFSFL